MEVPLPICYSVLWLDASGFTSTSRGIAMGRQSILVMMPHEQISNLPSMHRMGFPMEFDGAAYYEWEDINDIRTIFWVIKADSNNDAFLLGDDEAYHFHDNNTFWHSSHTCKYQEWNPQTEWGNHQWAIHQYE